MMRQQNQPLNVQSLGKHIQKLLSSCVPGAEKEATNTKRDLFELVEPKTPVDEELLCPITCETMRDPVVLVQTGITYEREYLCEWLLLHPHKDPSTGEEFYQKLEFVPNYTVRAILTKMKGEHALKIFIDSTFKEKYDAAWESVMLGRLKMSQECLPDHVLLSLAEAGHAAGQYEYGRRLCANNKNNGDGSGPYWVQRAAKQGHSDAQYELSKMSCVTNSMEWRHRAAKQGNLKALSALGCCYRDGESVARDDKQAFKYFLQAAKGGDALAQYNVAVFLYEGRGTSRDVSAALQWLKKAAAKGDSEAKYMLKEYQRFQEAGYLG